MESRGKSSARIILVIDENRHFRRYIGALLEDAGHCFAEAETAGQGLDLARSIRPDLILLNLGWIRDLAGERALAILKSESVTKNLSVVAMSGIWDAPEDEARVKDLGADGFVSKSKIIKTPSVFLHYIEGLLMSKVPLPNAAPAADQDWVERLGAAYTVLVIDDEQDTVERLKILFRSHPYRFLWASSGEQGLRLAAAELPDLVVLDLTMPGMSGQEVCRRLRAQEADIPWPIPILILTADARLRQEAHLLDLGADDYVVKTASHVRLMARIRNLIRRRRFHGDARGLISKGAVTLDTSRRELRIKGQAPLKLTFVENVLCTLLMGALGKPISEETLSKKLYQSPSFSGSRILKNEIGNLQLRLGASRDLIKADENKAYRFNVEYVRKLAEGQAPDG